MKLKQEFWKIRNLLMESASNLATFRVFFFRSLLVVSGVAALFVALGEQGIFHLPEHFPLMQTIMLVWVACHVPFYFMSGNERVAGLVYSVYLYGAFAVLTIVFQTLNVPLFDKMAYQLPQNYSLLFVALLLLHRSRYLVFSTIVCGTTLAYILLSHNLLMPPVEAGAVSALVSHTFGQWILGAIASALMESYFRQMIESKAQLARHNETLEEEVAAKAMIIKQQQEHLYQSQKMEAIGQLAGGVAHDFNNLLTIIQGHSDLLSQELVNNDQLLGHVEEIIHASKSSGELIQQLLAFSRKQVMELRKINLNAVVRKMKNMLRRLIDEGVELTSILDEHIGTVMADLAQIEQIVVNLVVNARDAMPEGGKITIQTANLNDSRMATLPELKPGPYAVLSISDTGVGMTDEVRSRIFEPFFTTKEPGKGTGLGLSTVYGIVKQIGGEVEVESEPDQGTTFKVYLPVVTGLAEDMETKMQVEDNPMGSETILLVEDKERILLLVSDILRRGGYTVLETSDARTASTIFSQHAGHVHLLVTDVVMPEMTGVSLAKQIHIISPATKVLYMSGYADNDLVQKEVVEAGQAYIEKPFTPGGLLRKVREVLDAPTASNP